MEVAFLDVLGVDWLEFAADFAIVCFFVAFGMAPPSALFPVWGALRWLWEGLLRLYEPLRWRPRLLIDLWRHRWTPVV